MVDGIMDRFAKIGATIVETGGGIDPEIMNPEPEEQPEVKPEPAVEPKVEIQAEPEINKYKIASELFGFEGEDEETFNKNKTSFFEKAQKAEEYEKELERVRAENDELAKTSDWKKYFDREEDYKFMQLKRQFPDLNANVLQTVIYADTAKIPPLEILAKQNLLKDGDIYANEQEAMEAVMSDFGMVADVPFEEQERSVQLKIKKAAKQARLEFDTIKQNVKLPEIENAEVLAKKKQDIETKQSQIRSAVDPFFSKTLPDAIKKIDFSVKKEGGKDGETEELFSFEIGENYLKSSKVQKLFDRDKELIVKNALTWDKNSEKEAMNLYEERLKADYLYHNRGQILQSALEKKEKELADKYHFEIHNPKPLNDGTAPAKEVTESEKQRQAFKDDMKSKFRRR